MVIILKGYFCNNDQSDKTAVKFIQKKSTFRLWSSKCFQRLKFGLLKLLKTMWNECGIRSGGITTGEEGLEQETMPRQLLK